MSYIPVEDGRAQLPCTNLVNNSTDIKPQNILIETPAIDDMFRNAPSEVFRPLRPPLPPPDDFYMESNQITSAEEDLATSAAVSVRLADFGSGECI
jgi:serine/threonine-protein kinase SRPK3